MNGKREEKLERFVRMFGEEYRGMNKNKWANSVGGCGFYGVIWLLIVLIGTGYFVYQRFAPIEQVSFSLRFASENITYRRGEDECDLNLYGQDGEAYVVESENIERSEVFRILAVLRPGMQIDVLVGGNGICELIADGEVLLSQETAAENARDSERWVIGALVLFGFLDLWLWIRFAALRIKERKGWNF